MNKKELRKLYLKKRAGLTAADYDQLNQQLFDQFAEINLNGIQYLHLFLPIREQNEPDTFILVTWLKKNYPAIRLVYPKANFQDSTMQHFVDDSDLKLQVNSFGIPEPISGNQVNIQLIDLVIVPLLVFDRRGYRVGYGKGFYDRFIAQCKPGTQFIGLSLFEPVAIIDDINSFDMVMHQCITPEKIWQFS